MTDVKNHANLVWGIAELLRGDYSRRASILAVMPATVALRLPFAVIATT